MATEKLTIVKVTSTDTKKDGSKCIDKNGKPFWKVGIKTNEYGEMWLNNNYMTFNPTNWEGTTQELDVYDEEFNGKTDKKFKVPFKGGGAGGSKGAGMSADQLSGLKRQLDSIETKLGVIIGKMEAAESEAAHGF